MTIAPLEQLGSMARSRPHGMAVRLISGPSFTWRELADEVDRLRSELSGRRCVLLVLPPGAAFPVAALAVGSESAILASPDWRREELSRALAGLGPGWRPDAVIVEGVEGRARVVLQGDPRSDATGGGFVQFSSGTSGSTRAVARGAIASLSEGRAFADSVGLSSEDVLVTTTSLHHSYAFGVGFMAALASGSCFVPLGSDRPPRALVRDIALTQPTAIFSVPAIIRALALAAGTSLKREMKQTRLLVSAGSPLPSAVRALAEQALALRITNLYGTTETGVLSCERPAGSGGVGEPVRDVEFEVRDGARRLGLGEVGELFARTPRSASEYIGETGRREDVFSGGWVRTRDRGWLDSAGRVHLAGRLDDVINVAGRKVDPVEVEEVLLGMTSIEEAVVLRVADGDDERVAALVRSSLPVTLEEVRRVARQTLSDHKAPQLLRCVSEIPRDRNGKVSRSLLAQQFFALRKGEGS